MDLQLTILVNLITSLYYNIRMIESFLSFFVEKILTKFVKTKTTFKESFVVR